jgi:hypothetical protein
VRDTGRAKGAGDGVPASSEPNAELAVLWPLLGRPIAFHRRLVDLTASVKAALLLSQTIYWTRHGRDIAYTGGWFFKTTHQWEMETGLSAKEQVTARQVLRQLAILKEQRIGVPAKLHFRLAVERLGALLSDRLGSVSARVDWADAATVAALLGPALSYHRTLAAVAGGVNAGLLLSRALYLTRVKSDADGWFCQSMPRWTEEIGLTRREQETARRELARAGIWEEAITGIPPRLFGRIRLGGLLARLIEHVGGEQGAREGFLRPVFQIAGFPPADLHKTAKQDCGNPAHMSPKPP